jgi:hypothetical protein
MSLGVRADARCFEVDYVGAARPSPPALVRR